MKKLKICHLSSAHPRYDVRIFRKQCNSLASKYDVTLVVADGKGNEEINNIKIIDIGANSGRFNRIVKSSRSVYNEAIRIDAEVYHFHDPELLPFANKLIKAGKKVIYDVHEDLPRQILSKHWIPPILRHILSWGIEKYENYISRKLTHIVTATPYIRERFKKVNHNSIDINNYPILHSEEFKERITSNHKSICYVGAASKIRGFTELIQAMNKLTCTLHYAGTFSPASYGEEVKKIPGYSRVINHGQISPDKVNEVLADSLAGIVTFHPLPNHVNAQPNKIFEYMEAGLPVICSDFKLWRNIVLKNKCGLTVNPKVPSEIVEAVNFILNNPETANKMGENGRRAVLNKYNWNKEKEKLQKLYSDILN